MMTRIARWFAMGIAGLAGLAAIAGITIFILSGQILNRRYEAKAETLAPPSAAQIADAARQARIHGCVSCHGENLHGKLMYDIPNVARIFAPNITQIAARSSDQQLAAAIRQGIGHDGRPLFVMPSPQYSRLDDAEVAALIGWIRRLPPAPGNDEALTVRPLGRVAVVAGKIRPATAIVEEYQTKAPIDLGPSFAIGQRLASKSCAECHGPALYGETLGNGDQAPDLAIAGAYDLEQFRTLLKTGRAPGNKKLDLMKRVAEKGLSHLRDDEIQALHAYLKARAERLSR